MKICLVSQEYPPETGGGGIGTQTYLKAQGLSARGHDVHVVSSSWDRTPREYQDGGALIHRVAEPKVSGPGFESSSYWLAYSAAVAEALHVLCDRVSFDVVQFPEYCGEGFAFQTDTFAHRKARYVVQCHGPLSMFAEHMGWPDKGSTALQIGTFMERMVIHHSDILLASSACTAKFCAEFYQYPLSDISVILSGIDTARFSPAALPVELNGDPRILFVGNLVGSKGFDLLLDAVLGLRKRYPQIVLRTIGKGDSEHVARARRKIAAAGAEGNFDILGYVRYDDLPGHYAWCDLFAGPSKFEPGPGNVYLEAMACGRPVIACNTGGAPEVVQDGETGLLVPPSDPDALTMALTSLIDDSELRRRFGINGRAWVESNVSLDRYIDRVEQIYSDAISR